MMPKLLYALTAAAFLGLLVLAAPSHADGWQDRIGAVLVAAPNEGAVLGAGLSYQLHQSAWLDLFAKRNDSTTSACAGLSTDLQVVADLVSKALNCDVGTIPQGWAGGCATPVTEWQPFAYLAWHTSF